MDGFYPFMKVALNEEYGVVTTDCIESNGSYSADGKIHQGVPYTLYGLIRWDTAKTADFEDWRGLWGTILDLGGHEIAQTHTFRFINNDGSLKEL